MTKKLLKELRWLVTKPNPNECFQERELVITARDGKRILKALGERDGLER